MQRNTWVAFNVASPTPYPGVNAIVQEILSGAQTVLVSQFVGMYLDGSLAAGDFDPERSDIDFVVVTDGELSDETIADLKEMHSRIAALDSKWATEIEGSYIPQRAIRRYDPTHSHYPRIERGANESLSVRPHDADWVIHFHILREHGIALVGPYARTLIDPVPPDELRRAVLGIISHEWWVGMLYDSAHLEKPGYRAYTILTACRMLYTLQYGAIVSKPAAARWTQIELGKRWAPVIERALIWKTGAPLDDVRTAQELIRYTVEQGQQIKQFSKLPYHS